MRFKFIEKHSSEFSVTKMCEVLAVSRSGFFRWRNHRPSQQELRKKEIQDRITYHFNDNYQRYGSPKITQLLWREKFIISERTVGIYMKELGLRSCVSKKFKVVTTDSNHTNPIAPNLLNQDFTVSTPNMVWVTDITYIPCREGKLYLAAILDLCTREIVGWRLKNYMNNELVLEALDSAYKLKQPGKGLIHHSDRGTQYTSKDYRGRLEEYKMIASMSRTGNCYDNACAESFFSLLKKELIQGRRFQTKEQAYNAIYGYIEFFYNRKRIHSSIGYMSPFQYAKKFTELSNQLKA
ncbi:IS3 family transposase [Anaerobacillus isosaccharinicus]|uniref:IS3 family transposase n=2 Tax=Anaerobacillus isosaccharinicus TaxID=1532552 RepID=A0A7S7RE64_9BACI|nr:IS3 family transposase [Anaerobacillus isosaccharinicus]MBA5586178.1 IS3 family transposase [Anaerobacillus isosaccharinicus]QOY38735.1 IS3 family transposase [Anaerobacillus isosaccharinicus]